MKVVKKLIERRGSPAYSELDQHEVREKKAKREKEFLRSI